MWDIKSDDWGEKELLDNFHLNHVGYKGMPCHVKHEQGTAFI